MLEIFTKKKRKKKLLIKKMTIYVPNHLEKKSITAINRKKQQFIYHITEKKKIV